MRRTMLAVLMATPALVFGQLDSYSVTITATRTVSLQPDHVGIEIDVTTPVSAGLTDVVAALQGTGITVASFTGVNSDYLSANLAWTFESSVALSKLNDSLTSLSNSQQTIAKVNPGWSLAFSTTGTQVSPALQASNPCSTPDLMSDARAQAQKLASAAGFGLGGVWSVSDGGTAPQTVIYAIASVSALTGIFVPPAPVAPPCSIVVKFKLIGN